MDKLYLCKLKKSLIFSFSLTILLTVSLAIIAAAIKGHSYYWLLLFLLFGGLILFYSVLHPSKDKAWEFIYIENGKLYIPQFSINKPQTLIELTAISKVELSTDVILILSNETEHVIHKENYRSIETLEKYLRENDRVLGYEVVDLRQQMNPRV